MPNINSKIQPNESDLDKGPNIRWVPTCRRSQGDSSISIMYLLNVILVPSLTTRVRRRALTLKRGRAIHARLDPLVIRKPLFDPAKDLIKMQIEEKKRGT